MKYVSYYTSIIICGHHKKTHTVQQDNVCLASYTCDILNK